MVIYTFFFFLLAETIFLNQDLEERSETQEQSEEEDSEKLFWLEPCYKALVRHRKDKHVQVGHTVNHWRKIRLSHHCYFDTVFFFLPDLGGCLLVTK